MRPLPAAPAKAAAPVRGEGGDDDLRVMLSEVASAKACDSIRGGFHALRAADQPQTVTGVLWIRECAIGNVGAHLTFHIQGNGWQWVDEKKDAGGATFAVRQYVRFGLDATIRGALDFAYDRSTHVATLWFTPERAPEVAFTPTGDIDVDPQGVWSSVLGALGTVVAMSPEDLAGKQAKAQGRKQIEAQLADGLSVTIDLCTGLWRARLGRAPKGQMNAADAGETRRVPVEVQPGGVILAGPQPAGGGMTLQIDALQGAAKVALVCAGDAEAMATAFLAGRVPPTMPALASVDVRRKASLRIKSARCPVVVVVTPLGAERARFAWQRPAAELARSTGGPLIHCPARPKAQ